MNRLLIGIAIPVLLAGCSGLDIKTLRLEEVIAARAADSTKPEGYKPNMQLDGYVVYEPMIVIEISVKEVCTLGKDANGKCNGALVAQCAASLPFQMPDYSKPYLVKSRSGLGKAGVDVTIADGWKLGAIKDSSDNSGLLTLIGGILNPAKASFTNDQGAPTCKESGLYKLAFKGISSAEPNITLEPIKIYSTN